MKRILNKYVVYYYLGCKNILLQNLHVYFERKAEKASDEFWVNLNKYNKEKIKIIHCQIVEKP